MWHLRLKPSWRWLYGDQLTNMLQPFWALTALLGITGLKAKDILPYSILFMLGWRHYLLEHSVFVLNEESPESAIFPATLLIACLLIDTGAGASYTSTGVYTDGDQTITWLSAVDKANDGTLVHTLLLRPVLQHFYCSLYVPLPS